jgi:hypothetical protein
VAWSSLGLPQERGGDTFADYAVVEAPQRGSEIGEPKVGLENTRVELVRWGLYVGYVGFNNVQYCTIHIHQPVQWRRGMFHGSNGGTAITGLKPANIWLWAWFKCEYRLLGGPS